MSALALVKADFVAQLPFSDKIEEAQFRPFVQFAYTLDLLPLLGHEVLDAVDELTEATVRPYAAGLTIVIGDMVTRRERVYKALANAPTEPTLESTEWQYDALRTLWLHYLKPWWVQQAFSRFLPQHGKNITKAGVTQAIDRSQGTYDRPTTAERAELQVSIDSTAEALRSRLLAFARDDYRRFQANNTQGYDYKPLFGTCAPHASTRRHARRVRGV